MVSILYSVPPFRLKRVSLLGEALNSFGFTLVFLLGYGRFYLLDPLDSLLFAYISALVLAAQIVHEIEHEKEDKKENISNIFTLIGRKKSFFFIRFMLLSACIISLQMWYVTDCVRIVFPSTLVSALLFDHKMRSLENRDFDRIGAQKLRLYFRYLSICLGILIVLQNIILC